MSAFNLTPTIIEGGNFNAKMGVVNANSNNYNNLINKPSINGVPLEGNKTSEDLGIDNEIFVVHAYGDGTDGSTPVVDKEFDEIWDAIHSGKNVVAYYHNTNE